MGKHYDQLSLDERYQIAELRRAAYSLQKIAAAMGRSTSTISRELNRNAAGQPVGYRPAFAHQLTQARRWSGSCLDRNPDLRQTVLDYLSQGWSPAQVCGYLRRQNGRTVIGCETIYRFIYDQLKRSNDGAWRHFLPKAKGRRGRRRRAKARSSTLLIKHRRPILQRTVKALDRRQPGHWEADFMLFSKPRQAVMVLHERTSRFTIIVRTDCRRAVPTAKTIGRLLKSLPARLRRSITFDNGTEFAEHRRLHKTSKLQTFFCDPHSPWQKGGIENSIGRFRRFFPRKTDLDTLKPRDFQRFIRAYNQTPRQCLDFRTPAEVFSSLLHFKRDSTPSLRSG